MGETNVVVEGAFAVVDDASAAEQGDDFPCVGEPVHTMILRT